MKLKMAMCSIFFLASNFTKTFIVDCEATGHGIGAILVQNKCFMPLNTANIKETYSNPFMRRNKWSLPLNTVKLNETYSNPFIRRKCCPCYM
jgi:hypothetical protein